MIAHFNILQLKMLLSLVGETKYFVANSLLGGVGEHEAFDPLCDFTCD